jgi:hypothetical protein
MKRFQLASLALALALTLAACASRTTASATVASMQVTLRIRNNLSTPLTLRASQSETVLWNGSVAANATQETVVGPLTVGSLISLRATSAQGSVVSWRDSISVREAIVMWTIP